MVSKLDVNLHPLCIGMGLICNLWHQNDILGRRVNRGVQSSEIILFMYPFISFNQ